MYNYFFLIRALSVSCHSLICCTIFSHWSENIFTFRYNAEDLSHFALLIQRRWIQFSFHSAAYTRWPGLLNWCCFVSDEEGDEDRMVYKFSSKRGGQRSKRRTCCLPKGPWRKTAGRHIFCFLPLFSRIKVGSMHSSDVISVIF